MGNVKIISASAGSGKTYRLAYEYVRSVVEDPSAYRHILAVTFTNKATEEMSSRILERLHELAAGSESPYLGDLRRDFPGWSEMRIRAQALEAQRLILHDYSHFAVLTIDRFFQRLIRSFIRELGVDVNFNLELETDSLLSMAADALIDGSSTDQVLQNQLFAAARARIDDNKKWNVKESLLTLGRELFSDEYIRSHASGNVIPSERSDEEFLPSLIRTIFVKAKKARLDMTSKAAEMLSLIRSQGLDAEDFKGRSRSLVPYLEKVAKGRFEPLSNAAREALESGGEPSAWVAKTSEKRGIVESLIPVLQPLLASIDEIYKRNLRIVNSAALLTDNWHNFLLLSDLQQRVEQICGEQNIMPIAETNRMIARLVGGNDTPFIFEKAGNHFSRFMIDEFQDTSTSQWENFVPLLKNAISEQEGAPVLLIGDIKQAIYRWRGGDWQILSRRVHEEMGAERVDAEQLSVNFRSAGRIVEFVGDVIGRMVEDGNTNLNMLVAQGVKAGVITPEEASGLENLLEKAYKCHVQQPADAKDDGYVTLTVYGADPAGEFNPPVVEKVEELLSRGYSEGDIAVLVRSNEQGARIAQMLLAAGHQIVTQEALRVGSAAVSRFIISCLSLAANPSDAIQRAIFNHWQSRSFDRPLDEKDAEFFAHLAALSPEEAFEEIVLRFGLADRSAEVAYIQALHQQIVTFSARSVADIPLFLRWWNERGADASITMQGGRRAITVSTIHKSKGLEYKAVIVPYLSWKTSPGQGIVWAGTPVDAGDAQRADGDFTDVKAGAEIALNFPLNFKDQMAESFFAPRYYKEQVLAHIDALNMFYVAATRAEKELHLMTSGDGSRLPKNAIGTILCRVLGVSGAVPETEKSTSGAASCVAADSENGAIPISITEWGSPAPQGGVEAVSGDVEAASRVPAKASSRAAKSAGYDALHVYPTARPDTKIRLKLPSSRYFSDLNVENDEATTATRPLLSPRDFGVLMHRAFESAKNVEDVRRAIAKMAANATISQTESADLQQITERAFENPIVAEWFGGEWDSVRNESDILTPRDASTKRPDRVMTRGNRAVVVDYKFGAGESAAHGNQLRGYMSLLQNMGYTTVEGYIWYVSLGKIAPVAQ